MTNDDDEAAGDIPLLGQIRGRALSSGFQVADSLAHRPRLRSGAAWAGHLGGGAEVCSNRAAGFGFGGAREGGERVGGTGGWRRVVRWRSAAPIVHPKV